MITKENRYSINWKPLGGNTVAPKINPFSNRQRMRRQTFELYRHQDLYPDEMTLHHHGFYEVNLFLSGNVNYTVENRTYRIGEGDVLLVSPAELHQPVAPVENQKYERFVLWIDQAYLQRYTQLGFELTRCFDPHTPGYTNLIHPDNLSLQYLIFLLEQLQQESDSAEFASDLCAQTYLVQVLITLNRLAQRKPKTMEIRDKSESVVTAVLNYINSHYNEDLSLDLLANKFFISKYHLSREFGRLTGTSVYRYIIQKRLVIAKQLMSEGVPSTAVYQQCGFGDYSNFYRAFKAEYQVSPKEFIARLKEENRRSAELGWE